MFLPVRNLRILLALAVATFAVACTGCFTPWFRKEKEGAEAIRTRRENIKEKLKADDRPTVLREIAGARLLTLSRLENVGMVNNLPNTGGTVRASQQREKLLDNMRREDVADPNTLLDSPKTAMVVAITDLPPAARRGQRFDTAVTISAHAEATSLQDGWLMPTSLMEMKSVGGVIREGFKYATAEGPLVTRQQITGSDLPEDRLSGIVIGGGMLLKQRELGIGINSEWAEAITMAAVVPAINERFTMFNGTEKRGIAVPEENSFISLTVPPKYEQDPFHFSNVVLNIAFNEGAEKREQRMRSLEALSRDPRSARQACWELEALGEVSIPMLASNLDHPSAEVRFYNAHALAYLNDKRAVPQLEALCRQEPAFRAMCLNGLKIIDNFEAADALERLLSAADAETRYGALRALREREPTHPLVAGESVPDVGTIIEVPNEGPPMVAVSLQRVPEVVIFGTVPQLELPVFEYVTPEIIIQRDGNGGARISRLATGKEDRFVTTSSDLRSVLTGIASVGGTYGDWISFLRVSSNSGHLMETLAINPIPDTGRTYNREKEAVLALDTPADTTVEAAFEAEEIAPTATESVSEATWYNPFTWFGSGS